MFGRSVIIHTEPVREIVECVHRGFGADNPERPLVMYDAAHVLGLLGGHFQDPLAEGADVVTGSTHKTFFGPQRGVILTNITPGHVFEEFWQAVASRAFPGHVSNHHLGTLLGLLGATCEMIRYRDEYPPRVIRNAKAFACALAGHGLAIEGDPAAGYTDTHQVLVRGARGGRRRDGGSAGAEQRHHQPAGVLRRCELRRRFRHPAGHPGDDPVRHGGGGFRGAGGARRGHPPR